MNENKQLLLVEDDLYSAETLKFALEAKGHDVTLATNGRDALNMVNDDMPQLIILDVMMPKMDGYHFCRLIKFDARYKHIPIIIVSSKIQDADRELGLACGANEYITKPYDLNILISTVEESLNNLVEEVNNANI
ncbi:MAG: response regulator [Candidatus Scalindua sp.]|jgi:DNA-binding response OmpR family regulator|nr:response regulator [Candidatus Scalindua sp.]MBT5305673.1 response regulator [Candidatus Scalindua sp.]MBT6051209.1 response regulator [Candidatus Scalindua sp.]MBT6561461.1 response regulator [Candidatus Scalindua sp.]MBT7213331.1 response regulator [Candidatus Scalindua sp.]